MEKKRGPDGPKSQRGRSTVERAFGRRVREARDALGVSLSDLCEELERHGVKLNTSQVSKIEHADRPTNVAEVVALKHALHLASYDQLLGFETLTDLEKTLMADEWLFSRAFRRRADLERELRAALEEERQIAERLRGWRQTCGAGDRPT